MENIEIKIENEEECEEDIKPQIDEGGIIVGSGGGAGATTTAAGAAVGEKNIVEKQQAALKVANEAKQLNLRLRTQKQLLQPTPPPPPPKPTPTTIAAAPLMGKRRNSGGSLAMDEGVPCTFTKIPIKYGNKRFRAIAPKPPSTPPQQTISKPIPARLQASSSFTAKSSSAGPPISSSRCGEIFVTNNANKWTFVCTYCQKTTRDIGAFICHIKFKHMGGSYIEDDHDVGNDEHIQSMATNSMEDSYNNSNEQDVRSLTTTCSNYKLDRLEELTSVINNDINITTTNSKIPTIIQVSSMAPKKPLNSTSNEYFDCTNYLDVNVHTDADDLAYNGQMQQQPQQLKPNTKLKTKDNKKSMTTQRNKYVVDLIDEEEEEDNENADNNDDSKFHTEVFDYDMDEDEDGLEIVDDDGDNNETMEGDDDQLLLRKLSFMKDEFNGGGDDLKLDDSDIAAGKKYRSHVRGKAYCSICDKTFQYYSLYRNHMIKHSNVTPYKCQYCSKAFKSKQAIRYHMNTHTKEVQYTCPLCPTTYGTENQFVTHVLNHESDDCFPCMVCAKILKSDQEREKHLETHTEERPFGCEYCNKRFRLKHHLSNHLKLHCQYRCDFCREEFASTQTQRRPYACPTCESFPDIRHQVEKQRSKTLNNSEVNPLELSYDNAGQDMMEGGDCVDLAESEDDESETGLLVSANGEKRVPCKHCTRTYKHISALNYHMRMKHPHEYKALK